MDQCQKILIMLDEVNDHQLIGMLDTIDNDTQDHLAIIAIKSNDYHLFKLLDKHHPRKLMDLLSCH